MHEMEEDRMNNPPRWPGGQACPNCASQFHDRIVHNLTPLHGPWTGWRMAGRDLVSPDGERIPVGRMHGILFREAAMKRLAKCRRREAPAQVIMLPARERFDGLA